jgi:hypothetical protein
MMQGNFYAVLYGLSFKHSDVICCEFKTNVSTATLFVRLGGKEEEEEEEK